MPNSTSRRVGTATNYIFSTNYGCFVPDDYKLRQNLTLNLGLRYEIPMPAYEKYGQETNYVPGINKLILCRRQHCPESGVGCRERRADRLGWAR
jgi:hypothetical protein